MIQTRSKSRKTLKEACTLKSSSSNQSLLSSRNSLSRTSFNFEKQRDKGFSFGSSPRNSFLISITDGPAAKYMIKGLAEINLTNKAGATFGSGRKDSIQKTPLSYISKNWNPGPGSYQAKQQTAPGCKIGHEQKQLSKIPFLNSKSIQKYPGPGAYQPNVIKLTGGKISSKSTRFEKSNKQNQPGPGAYNLKDDFVSKGSDITTKKMIKLSRKN